ncbi:MAG: zinc-binding dehydrogenase [Nocardioidaceae bacterium]
MRAIHAVAFGGPEVLELTQLPSPAPATGDAVVGVEVAPVLYLDTQIRAGLAREWFPARPPYVPGAGVAGIVASVGPDTDPSWIGRRVVADTPDDGGYREQAVVPVDRLIPVPDGVDLPTAAALLHDGRTALALIEATEPQPGEWVVVLGAAGGLGALLVQLAHRAGARVLAAARGEHKLALATRLGADQTVDYTRPDWVAQASQLIGGHGADVIFDGVGGQIGRAAFGVTAAGGRFSAHGAPAGGFAPIDPAEATRRGITVLGIDRVQLDAAAGARLTTLILSRAGDRDIAPVIGQTFPLAHASDAHRAIESRAVTGKTLLEV